MIRKHYKQSDNTKQVINYDNAALYYSGRWNFDTVGMCSGWQGSQIRFRFKGTDTIKLNVFLDITTTTDVSICTFHIDNYSQFASAYNIHTAGTIFNGNKSIEIPVINDGEWQDYLQPLTITDSGIYLIKYKSMDEHQNIEQEKTLQLQIDLALIKHKVKVKSAEFSTLLQNAP